MSEIRASMWSVLLCLILLFTMLGVSIVAVLKSHWFEFGVLLGMVLLGGVILYRILTDRYDFNDPS